MFFNYSNATLTHVTISGNTGDDEGGGMYIRESDPTPNHVTIANNTVASYGGGGIYLFLSNPTLTHMTIVNNTAGYGGGMYLEDSNPTLTNSILWDNSPESIYLFSGTPIITYSDIEGSWEGEGNIDSDPLLMNPIEYESVVSIDYEQTCSQFGYFEMKNQYYK